MSDLFGIYNEDTEDVPGMSTGSITSLNTDGTISVQSHGRSLGEVSWPFEGTPAVGDEVCLGFPNDASGSAFVIGWSR